MVNNNEDSEYSDDSSQSYDSDISPQNMGCDKKKKPSESKNDEFSDEEIESDMHHGAWINARTERLRFPFIGIQIK